jgi:hypothetical protein
MKTNRKMKVYKRSGNRPEIRLLGHWLAETGYNIGTEICVTILDNDKILIEKYCDTIPEGSIEELEKYFDDKTNILKWIREKGGIKTNDISCDTFSLTQKESGYKGRSSLVRKNGRCLDVLRDEAECEGIIPPNTSTDEFGDLIKGLVR